MSKLRAREAFHWGQRSFNPGQLVDDDDAAVKAFPHLFETDESAYARQAGVTADAVIERATAAPGEKRASGRRKKPVKKDDDK